MTKYLMIFSHCIIHFCEFGFHFSLQPELLIDEIDSLLSFLCPLDLSFFGAALSPSGVSLGINAVLG